LLNKASNKNKKMLEIGHFWPKMTKKLPKFINFRRFPENDK